MQSLDKLNSFTRVRADIRAKKLFTHNLALVELNGSHIDNEN